MTDKQIICKCNDKECGQCSFEEQLKAKEQECEELREWKKEHLKDVEFIERNPVIDILNSMADNILLEQRNEKLSKTLTEIKEIAEKAKKDICNNCGWRNTDSCDAEDYTCGEFIKILQKISEVEDEFHS